MSPPAIARAPKLVLVVGGFPPPLGGAAKNNELIAKALEGRGARVERLSVSGSSHAHRRTLRHHLLRALRSARAGVAILRSAASKPHLYVVPDAGLGLVYTAALLAIAARLGLKITLHHRSYAYIDRRRGLMRVILSMTRGRADHVFLSAHMRERFQGQYGPVESRVVTNAAFVERRPLTRADRGPSVVLGHLSNLCFDKGYHDVVEAFEAARAEGYNATLKLAGPILEPGIAEGIEDLRARYDDAIEYLGPLDGAAKYAFYEAVDIFLFPTRFAQEAQPNVVYEAMSMGAYVIASERGCISVMLDHELAGRTAPVGAEFSRAVVEEVASFGRELARRRQARTAIVGHFARLRGASEGQLADLLSSLT